MNEHRTVISKNVHSKCVMYCFKDTHSNKRKTDIDKEKLSLKHKRNKIQLVSKETNQQKRVNFYFENSKTFVLHILFCKYLTYMSSEINEFCRDSMHFHIIETLNLSHLMV